MLLDSSRRFAYAFALASLCLLVFDNPLSAETYQWTDKNGSVGFADSLGKVPPEYRKSARRLEEGSTGKSFQTLPGASEPNFSSPQQPPAEYSPRQDPDYWRDRLSAAQAQLAQLQQERQAAQAAYEELLGQYGRGTKLDPDAEGRASSRVAVLNQRIYEKETEIAAITEEARQAGMPSSLITP